MLRCEVITFRIRPAEIKGTGYTLGLKERPTRALLQEWSAITSARYAFLSPKAAAAVRNGSLTGRR